MAQIKGGSGRSLSPPLKPHAGYNREKDAKAHASARFSCIFPLSPAFLFKP
jgi:hypothetical protein